MTINRVLLCVEIIQIPQIADDSQLKHTHDDDIYYSLFAFRNTKSNPLIKYNNVAPNK